MKPIVAGVVMLGSMVAGAFGGVAGNILFGPAPTPAPAPRAVNAPAPAASTGDNADDRSLVAALDELRQRQADEMAGLRRELQLATDRLKSLESAKLTERVDALDRKLEHVDAVPSMASSEPGSAPGPALSADSPAFQEALEAALQRREEERRAKEEADRTARMTDMMARQSQQILDTLNEKVSLSDDQKVRVSSILDGMAKRRLEVMELGRQARDNNQDFDWPGEMQKVSVEATESVRSELDASQQAAFDQAVGDQGLDALGWGGGRGFGGPPRGR